MLNTKNILHTNLDLNKLFYKFSTKSGNARHLLKLHWAQFVPVLEWLKTGNELGVYINIHVDC